MWWIALLEACHRDTPEAHTGVPQERSGCDPLVPEMCALPFPSGYFEREDDTQVTRRRLDYGEESLPVNRDAQQIDGRMLNHLDGYSTATPLLTYFAGVSLEGTIRHDHLEDYTAADAKTVIVDLSTGERVPHWVELDMRARSDEHRLLMLRPAVPLAHAHRYAVGLRGLVRADGSPVDASPAFRALRDGAGVDDPDLAFRVETFDGDVFPALEAQGFARAELQLAWEFGTVSRESSLGPAIAVRDAALAEASGGIAYTIDSVEDADCAVPDTFIARTVYGTVTTARYTDTDLPGARLVLDDQGRPVKQGTTAPRFMVRIPCSIAADPRSGGRILQYGHGLLGDLSEAKTGYLSELADEHRWVVFAMTWTGMSTYDAPWIAVMLATDPSDFPAIPERTVQGFSEWMVGLELATTTLPDDDALKVGGARTIDASVEPVYYGNSQGAILGGAYLALSPKIGRGVLGVGGMPYSVLLSRSADFEDFIRVFHEKFPDDRDTALLLGVFQSVWDPGESAGYGSIMAEPLPGTPPKRALLQVAEGDAQVTTLGAGILARAWGMVTLEPQNRPIWGVDEVAGPVESSAVVEWHYTDGSIEPHENVPPDSAGDTHECPRREPDAQEQLAVFLETGTVTQTCDGKCVGTRAGFCD